MPAPPAVNHANLPARDPEPEGDAEYTTTRIHDPEGNEVEIFFEVPLA